MIGMAAVKAFLGGNGLVLAAIAGLVVTAVSWDRVRIDRAEQRGGQHVVVDLNTQAKEKADAARQARLPARQPGATERLRQRDHCRNC